MRAQGYNGDTNMQREINGLKTLILQDNPSANCTHCFAQPLHFTLVTVAKRQCDVGRFFAILTFELNVIGASFERQTISQENQDEKLKELLNFGKVLTWRDPVRIVHVLEVIASLRSPDRMGAEDLQSFEFVYMLHFMLKELAITKDLSPINSFANYDKDKIMRLAKYYPNEFGDNKLQELSSQLDDYIVYMRQSDNKLSNLKGLGDLSK
uniref:Uncharacterized protein LOC104219995 n=1 Tax=Nicotiana sylvestris TaxID=4096 RepID=A0A1U7VM88_NICSY